MSRPRVLRSNGVLENWSDAESREGGEAGEGFVREKRNLLRLRRVLRATLLRLAGGVIQRG